MFESKSGVLLIGGLGFFLFAFLSNALVPMLLYPDLRGRPVEEVINQNIIYQFEDLSVRYPEQFEKYYGEPNEENLKEALLLGRKWYIGEGCWHCHSQFVRPVSNESVRWGKVSSSDEYQNELQRPVMFGTRRVGPDLSREGGRRGNDWHAVHFHNPRNLSPKLADAEVPLVLRRRRSRQAQQARLGDDYLRAVARFVAGAVSALRRLQAAGRTDGEPARIGHPV